MIFGGYGFASGGYSLGTTPTSANTVEILMFTNGIYDESFLSRDINDSYDGSSNHAWDINTVLHAEFDGNMSGGNIDFSLQNVDMVRIKRRIKGSFNWVTIFECEINGEADLHFNFLDFTARANTTYEYAFIPMVGGNEGVMAISEFKTDFSGVFITEQDSYFTTQVEVDFNSQQQNRPVAVINTLGKKYPFVISNGHNNYKSGTLGGVFALFDQYSCSWDFENGWKYRERLNDFLYDNNPKLIKYDDGRMYLASVSSSGISESEMNHELFIKTTLDWTEIGNCDDGMDLYNNGLIKYEQK